jgi:fructose-bisphosphate aldolase class II
MLVNLRKMMADAERRSYAVGGFNITTLETALGIIEAGIAEKSPVILQISEKTIKYMGLDLAFAVAKTLADRTDLPVAIHFDHGRNFPLVEDALKIGFSSVMLDVSKMPKAERIPFVKDFVKKAHHLGATVEAEEDSIGGREDYIKGDNYTFTDPKRADQFVEQTGVDLFAVSIGNSHGKPLPNEKLHLDLLSKIKATVSTPLVLHGASSTPPEIIREAIARGIRKINIDTDIRLAFTRGLRETLQDKEIYDPRDELQPSIEEVKQTVIDAMRHFGSSGKI